MIAASSPAGSRAPVAALLLGVVLLGAALGYQLTRPAPPPPPLEQEWTFRSVRLNEDPANPANHRELATGDRLLAFAPEGPESCTLFLQDKRKLETTFTDAQLFDNGGVFQRVGGIQLGAGKGEVRLVLLCTPVPLRSLEAVLVANNEGQVPPDQRLVGVLKEVQDIPGMKSARLLPSPWYVLSPTTPPLAPDGAGNGEPLIQGAPSLNTSPQPSPATPASSSTPSTRQ